MTLYMGAWGPAWGRYGAGLGPAGGRLGGSLLINSSSGRPAFQSSIKMYKCSKLDVPSTSETFEDSLGHSSSKGVPGLGLAFLDDMILKPSGGGVKQTKYTDNYRCPIAVYMTNHSYNLAKAMTRVKI